MNTTSVESALFTKILIVLGAFLFAGIAHRVAGFPGAATTMIAYAVCVWAIRSLAVGGGAR